MATAGLTPTPRAERRGADGVIDLAADEIHREAHVVETDIAFEGVTGAAVAAVRA